MAKQKTVVKKSFSSVSMSINGAVFEASGDSAEVQAKLKEWLEQTLSPIRAVGEIARKTLSK
jgi:hypothetical protein